MNFTRSIRARLLTAILLTLVVILGTTAVWSYLVTRHESDEIFSARLATSARVLEALVARQMEHATITSPIVIALPREIEESSDDRGSALGHPYETKIAFQLWRTDGALLARSTSAPPNPFSPNVPGFSVQQVGGALLNVFVLRSGDIWIQVAEKDEVRDEIQHDLGVAVMTPLVVGAALLLVLVNALVIYGLAPLRQLTAGIERSAPDALEPISLRAVPAELAPVVQALNDLLARVRSALEHERRFTDAAAHELRTPLAALKIHADNTLRATDESERAASLQRLRQGIDRVTRLAVQLLAYSRAQSTGDRESRVPLLLEDVVQEALGATEGLRTARGQSADFTFAGPRQNARILGEPTALQRLVVNLLDNASRYAPRDSAVRVRIEPDAGHVDLVVENDGPPIPAELRSRVFEPYYRIPGSPSDGSGLGLAIVQELAARHGAGVMLDTSASGQGTIVTVHFPALQEADLH